MLPKIIIIIKGLMFFPDPDSRNYILVSRLDITETEFIDKRAEEQLEIIKLWLIKSIDELIKNIKTIK